MEVGLSQQGMWQLGTVDSVEWLGDCLRLEWSAYSVGGSDELYHAAWELVEGRRDIRMPVSTGAAVEVNAEALEQPSAIDEDTWCVRCACAVRCASAAPLLARPPARPPARGVWL